MKIGVVNVIQDDNKVRKFAISLQKIAGNTSNRMPKFVGQKVELVSKELNHLAAILYVYAGGLNFMK